MIDAPIHIETTPYFKPVLPNQSNNPFFRQLEKTGFRNSQVLRVAANAAETGQFSQGVRDVFRMLGETGVNIIYLPSPQSGTEITQTGEERMFLPDSFPTNHPAYQLWQLTHRNMSLILRRNGKRQDLKAITQLLNMDLQFAATLRTGARTKTDPLAQIAINDEADRIEFDTNKKLDWLSENTNIGDY